MMAETAGGQEKGLRLEAIETLPQPVINSRTPGSAGIPGGFEGGNTIKVSVGGKTRYHMFPHSYETLDWSYARVDHWSSEDGLNWVHHGALYRAHTDPVSKLWMLPCSPMPFYDGMGGLCPQPAEAVCDNGSGL